MPRALVVARTFSRRSSLSRFFFACCSSFSGGILILSRCFWRWCLHLIRVSDAGGFVHPSHTHVTSSDEWDAAPRS